MGKERRKGGADTHVYVVGWFVLLVSLVVFNLPLHNVLTDRSVLSETIEPEYDYIVVGGGSAGSVVAARLSEDKHNTVLLLEAGGFYGDNPDVHIPWKETGMLRTLNDWEYFTEPQIHSHFGMNEKRSYWPRGKILWGSSSINGMQYTRGSPYEYNVLDRNGCTGWGYNDVLPYFLKSEDIQIKELRSSKYHATGGPVAVSSGAIDKQLSDFFMKAGEEFGYKIADYNGKDQEGFHNAQLNVRNGVRCSTGLEFLGKGGRRDNLHVVVNTFVAKIEIKNQTATGVFYIRNGRKKFVQARTEVIISAGAVNSPQLLMLSGVGPKEHLQGLGIEVKADLPVGENLQDHLMIIMQSKINNSYGITPAVADGWYERMKYNLFGKGLLGTSGIDGSAFLYIDESRRGKTYPEIQFILYDTILYQSDATAFNIANATGDIYLEKDERIHGFYVVVCVTHPKSRGSIKLRSMDPFDYPLIDPRYLTDQHDISEFIEGIRMWENYIETPTMKGLGADVNQMKLSFCSQHEFRSDAYWECVIRHLAMTVYHPCGTCKMGAADDKTAVLDPQLRVKGIKGLRVVDASIFPNITTGNTNAPTIMAAEKLADMVRGIDTIKHLRVDQS